MALNILYNITTRQISCIKRSSKKSLEEQRLNYSFALLMFPFASSMGVIVVFVYQVKPTSLVSTVSFQFGDTPTMPHPEWIQNCPQHARPYVCDSTAHASREKERSRLRVFFQSFKLELEHLRKKFGEMSKIQDYTDGICLVI